MIKHISECPWEAHMIDVGKIHVKHLAVLGCGKGRIWVVTLLSLSLHLYHPSIYRCIPLLPLLLWRACCVYKYDKWTKKEWEGTCQGSILGAPAKIPLSPLSVVITNDDSCVWTTRYCLAMLCVLPKYVILYSLCPMGQVLWDPHSALFKVLTHNPWALWHGWLPDNDNGTQVNQTVLNYQKAKTIQVGRGTHSII